MLDDFGLIPTRASFVREGDVFGRLTVRAVGQVPGTYRYYAVCECACGSGIKRVRMDSLKAGVIVSCGCVHRELHTSHGQRKSPHYNRWRHMMDRCYNPECEAYPNYGGRGIVVCEAWHSIEAFIAGLPAGYQEGLEIDRRDNDGNYEPGNVRWATRSENTDNRRTGASLEWRGRTQSVDRWAKETGINRATIDTRLQAGWPIDQVLSAAPMSPGERMAKARAARLLTHPPKAKPATPPRELKRLLFRGEQKTIAEISAVTGVSIKLLRKRICERGWSVEKATA